MPAQISQLTVEALSENHLTPIPVLPKTTRKLQYGGASYFFQTHNVESNYTINMQGSMSGWSSYKNRDTETFFLSQQYFYLKIMNKQNNLQEMIYSGSQSLPQHQPPQMHSSLNTYQELQPVKLYVTLRKTYDSDQDYKRLTLIMEGGSRISELKRQIEKEFADLFPYEAPYIVAKLDDEYGFSLSNNSKISDFLKFGDRITALPEQIQTGAEQLHGGSNTEDLITMLRNLQISIVGKIAGSNVRDFRNLQELLETVIPLGFFRSNKQVIHNMCQILSKTLDATKVRVVFDDQSNSVLCELTLQMVRLWVEEFVDTDSFILTSVVELLEILLYSQRFWQCLKQAPMTTAKLLNISKRPSVNALVKTKIISLVTQASKPQFSLPLGTQSMTFPQQINRPFEEQKMDQQYPMSYAIDTAYYQGGGQQQQMRDHPQKTFTERVTQSRDRMERPIYANEHAYSIYHKARDTLGTEQIFVYKFQAWVRSRLVSQDLRGTYKSKINGAADENCPIKQEVNRLLGYGQILRSCLGCTTQLQDVSLIHDFRSLVFLNSQPTQIGARATDMSIYQRNPAMSQDPIQLPLNDNLLYDYCQMLSPDNNQEMQQFAIQALDQMLEESIRKIMSSSELFLRIFLLTEFHGANGFSFNIQQSQYKIIQKLADYMNEARAGDAIKSNGLQRLLKTVNQHNSRFQPIILNLIIKIVQAGRRSLDVKSLMGLTQKHGSGALDSIQDLAIKGLLELSENKEEEKNNLSRTIDSEFENFIPHLLDMAKNAQKFPIDNMRYSALQIVSNLSLRDYLRPQILSHGTLEFFLEIIKRKNTSLPSVEAQRVAAKGLVNLVSTRKEVRMQAVAELSEEIKMIYRNTLDPVVASFIQSLLHQKV